MAPLPDIAAIRPDLPAAVEDLLYRMLARNREDRIRSVRLVGAELEALLRETALAEQPQTKPIAASMRSDHQSAFATPTPEQAFQLRHNLPAQATPFVGRNAELAEMERLMRDPGTRLVTILGPGGMGKTRLSLEIGRRLVQGSSASGAEFPDGIFFVELATLTFQGFVALLQGQLDRAQDFSQRMHEIVVVRNNPRDEARALGFDGLVNATLGRYEAVDLGVFGSLAAGLLGVGPIGTALAAYGQGNIPLAAMTIIKAWSMPITMRWPLILLEFIPVVASLLADRGDCSRAAALLAMARARPACPHGWWEIMASVQGLEARLQAELSAEEYAAARARGREMDVRETAADLREEFKATAAVQR